MNSLVVLFVCFTYAYASCPPKGLPISLSIPLPASSNRYNPQPEPPRPTPIIYPGGQPTGHSPLSAPIPGSPLGYGYDGYNGYNRGTFVPSTWHAQPGLPKSPVFGGVAVPEAYRYGAAPVPGAFGYGGLGLPGHWGLPGRGGVVSGQGAYTVPGPFGGVCVCKPGF